MLRIMGGGSFERGRRYADQGLAMKLSWNDDFTELNGRVQGTDHAPYRTRVRFSVRGGELTNPRASCTCPVQENCKHAAALMLTSNAITTAGMAPDDDTPAAVAPDSAPPNRSPQHRAPSVARAGYRAEPGRRVGESARVGAPIQADQPAPAWQRTLDKLVDGTRQPAARGTHQRRLQTVRPEPLGLRFELKADRATRPRRGTAATTAQPTPMRLVARPVQRNSKGQWVAGSLTWESLRWSWYPHDSDPRQREWLRALVAVVEDDNVSPAMLRVDTVRTPVFWDLLARAGGEGITLVGVKNAPFTLHDAVAPVLDVTSPRTRLQIRPRVQVGDAVLDPATIGVIGSPGHGIFWTDPSEAPAPQSGIHLAPTTGPLPPIVESLLTTRRTLEIPGSGRDAFLGEYYPRLRQQTGLVSSDGSLDLPDVPPPTLVLSLRYRAGTPSRAGRPGRAGSPRHETVGVVTLQWSFEYSFAGSTASHALDDDGAGYRDHAAEQDLLALAAGTLRATQEPWSTMAPRRAEPFDVGHAPSQQAGTLTGTDAARFVAEAVPLLQDIGNIRVDLAEDLPDFEEITDRPSVSIGATDTDTRDWFDLAVTVSLGGSEVPFDRLFRALAEGQEHFLLDDGRYFALDQPEFSQLRRLIEEARLLQDSESVGLRISRYQAGLWDELLELSSDAEQSVAWRESVSGLLKLDGVERTPVPASVAATLRPYQQEGFSWLAFLWEHGLGGVLADDMGLGKTLQTLSLICHARERTAEAKPFLVVAPTSVVSNWATEAHRFAPGLAVQAISDTLRRSGADLAQVVAANDVVITSYTLFRLDHDRYAAHDWAGLILDEAQFVKNPVTQASQGARTFPAPFKLAITGTPLENNLMELWSLFAITAPGLFPSAKVFADYYQRPIEKESHTERLAQLRRRIRPLILRRTKEVVASELPPKQEQVLELDLAPKHRTIYQRHLQRERQKVLGLLGDMDRNRFEIFRSLTLLRRLCLDASLVDEKYASTPSSKLDVLFEQLEDIVAEGHRALIFSQFTGFLGKAAERLDAAGIEYAYLDGSTRKRGAVIETFKSGTAPVFLISLKAGGFGLNLAEADYCFLLDPWWNPASENQAVDRAHRIGQQRQVMVYRLVARDTIEEKVMELKERKAKLFKAVMDDDAAFSTALSAGDIRGLFE
ncbi:helicase [Arthrobacter echini]|uniref:Helicase n=2 Tax=Arthrobacter echini TaxID=1529066 RepID=A0A4S5E5R1_9MICC|nr:helicase [Arthrobacter echini]